MVIVWLIVAATVFDTSVAIAKALRRIPITELRRTARTGRAVGLYRLASFGRQTEWMLEVIAALGLTWLIIILRDWWLIGLVSLVAIWLITAWDGPRSGTWRWSLTDRIAGWLAALLTRLPIAPKHTNAYAHTHLYEKEDLLDLLARQAKQPDSRIPEAELKAAVAVLSFGNKKVSNAMTPLAKAKLVVQSDTIGPHLLDELHKAKTDSFVVVKATGKGIKLQPIGILYLADALEHPEGGSVKDAMSNAAIESIDEDLPLVQALEFFLERKAHTLIIMNGFDEIVGVLTLQNVLEQILGARQPEPKTKKDDKITPNEQSSK